MKAISLHQPYASAMICGLKRQETRSWRLPNWIKGQTVLLHAAKAVYDYDLPKSQWEQLYASLRDTHLPFGALLGIITFYEDIPTESFTLGAMTRQQYERELSWGNYAPGRFAWLSREPLAFKHPIPYRGMQGWFDVPESVVLEGRI